jgi:ABC-type siderophore export system fused ATPase/permease subunit
MLIAEILIVLVLFDVAAGIELSVDRRSDEWTWLYWVQLAAATGAVGYGLFALWANRELVEELALFLPHVVTLLVLLLPASVMLMALAATFALGYWSYRSAQ